MADFPAIQLPSDLDEGSEFPTIRTEFETGIVQTRARYSRIRRTWELTWADMNDADYRTLYAFYVDRRAGSLAFNWVNTMDGNTYNVRFKQAPDFRVLSYNYWTGNIVLEQV